MKLAGFVVLLAVIFIAAAVAGARFGPVTTRHSPVVYSGGSGSSTMSTNPGGTGGADMSGMNMGTSR